MIKTITITLELDAVEIRALERAIDREIKRIGDDLDGLHAVDEDKLNARRSTLEEIESKIATEIRMDSAAHYAYKAHAGA